MSEATCPCCQNVFDSTDQPDEYARVTKWSAARELGKLNRGHKKRLTQAQRQEKAKVLARNRAKKQVDHANPIGLELGHGSPAS